MSELTPYYEAAGIQIYRGDARDVLPALDAADLIATDPPYGVEYREQAWDKEIPEWWLGLACRHAKVVAFTTAPLTVWDYPRPDWMACWARPASSARTPQAGFNHYSPVLIYGKHKLPVDLVSLHAIAHASPDWIDHPCPKPVALYKWLISGLLPNGGRVIDPFMGSGTTLEAAKACGCEAVGIEIEERYCAMAVKRLSQGCLFGVAK